MLKVSIGIIADYVYDENATIVLICMYIYVHLSTNYSVTGINSKMLCNICSICTLSIAMTLNLGRLTLIIILDYSRKLLITASRQRRCCYSHRPGAIKLESVGGRTQAASLLLGWVRALFNYYYIPGYISALPELAINRQPLCVANAGNIIITEGRVLPCALSTVQHWQFVIL